MPGLKENLSAGSTSFQLVEYQGLLKEPSEIGDFLSSWWMALQREELVGIEPLDRNTNAHLLYSSGAPKEVSKFGPHVRVSVKGLPEALAQSLPTFIVIKHCASELPLDFDSVAKLHGDIAIFKLGEVDSKLEEFINTFGLALTDRQRLNNLQIPHVVTSNTEIPTPVTEFVIGAGANPLWQRINIDPIRVIFDQEYGVRIRTLIEDYITRGLIHVVTKDERSQERLTPYQELLLDSGIDVFKFSTFEPASFRSRRIPSISDFFSRRSKNKFQLPSDLPPFRVEVEGNVYGTETRIGIVETYAEFRNQIQGVIKDPLPVISSGATSLRDVRHIPSFCINVPQIGKVIFVFSQSSSLCVVHEV